jgi:hypothetical protein
MDRGIWATWYDLPDDRAGEYTDWLHGEYLPQMLKRPGYLWAAHIRNVTTPGREAGINRRLTHTSDPSVPDGYAYLLLFGAEDAHVFADPTPAELLEAEPARTREMLALRRGERPVIFTEVDRVDGPAVRSRGPGITPGPIVQFGTFNIDALENEMELEAWYAKVRLPMMADVEGCVGARKLVSSVGWPKHAILYEFTGVENPEGHFADPNPWSAEIVKKLVHAPHSPTLGTRIWPE